MKRRKQVISALLMVIVLLTGCNNPSETTPLPSKKAKIQSEFILQCVVNKDAEKMKELFCKTIVNTHDLDGEIEEFFDFIEGDIVSYDDPIGRLSGSSATEDKGVIQRELNGCIENIKTSTGGNYRIAFISYDVYSENIDYQGIFLISVTDMDSYEGEMGYTREVMIGEVLY